jgi:hypothetical protein
MLRAEKIRIAFFKGNKHEYHHRFIRWWCKSLYSHAEIVLDDGQTWVSISPFLYSRVTARVRTAVDQDDWDFIDLFATADEILALKDFISETTVDGYDWIGMFLSQVLPVIVKGKGRWYCSSWIAHALSHSGIVRWRKLGIYELPDLHPGRLHGILSQVQELPQEDTGEAPLRG